ncbi:hypothetical protein MRX96_023467 [Rhipicephalus microplus]
MTGLEVPFLVSKEMKPLSGVPSLRLPRVSCVLPPLTAEGAWPSVISVSEGSISLTSTIAATDFRSEQDMDHQQTPAALTSTLLPNSVLPPEYSASVENIEGISPEKRKTDYQLVRRSCNPGTVSAHNLPPLTPIDRSGHTPFCHPVVFIVP